MIPQLLQAASEVSGVWSLAAFTIAALLIYLTRRRGTVPPIAWAIVLLIGLLGLVPILATFKIFCDHIDPMAPIGEFMS